MSENLIQAINMLWQGMLGVLFVMALIGSVVYLMGKIGDK